MKITADENSPVQSELIKKMIEPPEKHNRKPIIETNASEIDAADVSNNIKNTQSIVKPAGEKTGNGLESIKKQDKATAEYIAVTKNIQHTNETLFKITEIVAQMDNRLKVIDKQYPPYPIDSTERSNLLREYGALRKLIDQLAKPFEVNINLQNRQNKQPLATTIKLNIPELSEKASDEQIKGSLKGIANTKKILGSKQTVVLEEGKRITIAI